MKIVYFGSDVYLSCFQYLAQEHEVLALYTYHNDEDYFTEYSIVRQADLLGIPVHYDRITEDEIVRLFCEEGCGLLFVAEYDRILPIPEHLPQFRGINTHGSLLPQGRSYYPIESAMDRDLKVTGVTMHKMTNSVDVGDIVAQREVVVEDNCDSIDVYLQCAGHAREMIEEIMSDLEGCWGSATPAVGARPYWPKPEETGRTLNHAMTRRQAMDIFRRFNKMTLVVLDGGPSYVTAVVPSETRLSENLGDELCVAEDRYIYRLADGHLRLNVERVEREERR